MGGVAVPFGCVSPIEEARDVGALAVVCVAAVVVFGPGLALLVALGIRERLVLLGAAPAASVGVALVAASISAMAGGRYGIPALVVATLLLAALGCGLWWVTSRFIGRPLELPSGEGRALLPELNWYLSLIAQLLGLVLAVMSALLTLSAWFAGLGSWGAWNQDHDPILHALLTAYIMRSGHGAPWQIMPADVLAPHGAVYYPDGFHLIAATIADVFAGKHGMEPASALSAGAAVTGMNAATAMLLGAAWVASAGSLAGVGVRWLCGGQTGGRSSVGWSSLGAGIGAVIAAGLYRPGMEMARDNGLLPNASALVLVPGVLTALLLIRPKNWTGALAVGFACAGVVAVHPSAGLSVGLSVLLIWLAMLCSRLGRATLCAQLPVLGVVLAAAALVGMPVLHGALAVSSRIEAFPPDSHGLPFLQTFGSVVTVGYGGMFDPHSTMQVWPTLLLFIGVGTALRLQRAGPLVLAWAGWALIVLLAYRNPRGITAPILGFFYNSVGRVQGHIGLFAPALATIGVFGLLAALLSWLGGLRIGPLRRPRSAMRPGRLGAARFGVLTAQLRTVTARLRTVIGRFGAFTDRFGVVTDWLDAVTRRLGIRTGRRGARSGRVDAVSDRLGVALTVPMHEVGTVAKPAPLSNQLVAALGIVVLFVGTALYLGDPTQSYLQTNAQALTQRWRYPQLYRVDGQTVEAANWLVTRVTPGERIMNSPNDGSTWLYVHDGLPIVELSTLGVPNFPYTWLLLGHFQDLALDHQVRTEILRRNIAWVYLDSRAPIIGASGAPENWTGGGTMTLAPGLTNLDYTPCLTLEHVVGTIRIYHVDQNAVRALDGVTPRGGP